MNPQRFTRSGYAVVIQDVRGTGDSEGQAYFWNQEMEDGYDSVEWVANQPWCDGNIGMYGFSYFGYTQWAAAAAQPPHLKTICPGMTQSVPHAFPFSAKGDKFKLKIHLGWCLMITALGLLRSKLPAQEVRSLQRQLIYLTDHIDEQIRYTPLKDSPAIKVIDDLGMMPLFSDILTHMDDKEYWEKLGGPLPLDKVNVPVFHIGAWYDVDMTPGVLASYQIMNNKNHSGTSGYQKLLMGPWVHSADMLNLIGQLDFGQASSGAVADVTGMHLRWFDRWLKGIENGVTEEPPVKIFVMGNNIWRDEKEWPLARTRYSRYYLHSHGQANSRSGDGALSEILPGDEPADNFLYDPKNPAPSNEMGMGAFDQQDLESRPDILVYTSVPLETDLEVTGHVQLVTYASSSAVDTDFSGKLVDVWPNGRAYNVAEGIVRGRYLKSVWEPKVVKPDEIYEYAIDLGSTSNVFKAGHRIRVEISSSNFPNGTKIPIPAFRSIKTKDLN